jgi:hypothetical protein
MTTWEHGTHSTCFPRMPGLGAYSPFAFSKGGICLEAAVSPSDCALPEMSGAARRQHSRHLSSSFPGARSGEDAGPLDGLDSGSFGRVDVPLKTLSVCSPIIGNVSFCLVVRFIISPVLPVNMDASFSASVGI